MLVQSADDIVFDYFVREVDAKGVSKDQLVYELEDSWAIDSLYQRPARLAT